MHAPAPPRPRTRFRRALTGAAAALLGLLVVTASPTPAAASDGVPAANGGTAVTPAADTVVVVVSSASPVEEMSRLHLSDLYLGRTSRYPDGRPAEPIDQEPGSDVRREFYQTYLGRSQSEIKAHWSKAVFTGRGRPPPDVEDGEEMKEALAGNPRAIGYIDRSLVDDRVRIVRVTGTD